jgi:hypothetical protein
LLVTFFGQAPFEAKYSALSRLPNSCVLKRRLIFLALDDRIFSGLGSEGFLGKKAQPFNSEGAYPILREILKINQLNLYY